MLGTLIDVGLGFIIGFLICMLIYWNRIFSPISDQTNKPDTKDLAKARQISAETRKREVLKKIDLAVKKLKSEQRPITKNAVAKEANLNYRTVAKYWTYIINSNITD